MYVVS